MDLKTKLDHLRMQEDLALFRWTDGKSRIAGEFSLLSNLRLNVLTVNKGRITFSAAAPVLYMDKGRTVIKLADSNVFTVTDGPRKGINILSGFLKEKEQVQAARSCMSFDVSGSEEIPKWIADKVMSIGCSPVFPCSRIVTPELYRITKDITSIRPLFTRSIIKAIGGERGDSAETLTKKFQQHILLFGSETDSGFVISNDYVASGGCCVASARGITIRTGSIVHSVPLNMFRDDLKLRGWSINTGD